jgi:two-component system response regulator GlrR
MSETNSKRILIVDDDPDILDQVTLALEPTGAAIVRAESAKEAEEWLEAETPDLAIFDLMMESADAGFTLCHRMKRKSPKTPVIVLTSVMAETGLGFTPLTAEERSWIKADAFMNKPVRPEELMREVGRLLRSS